jgi:hypothetical protein
MRKAMVYSVLLLLILGFLLGCGDDEPTSPGGGGPSPERQVYTWVNAEWSVGPSSYKYVSRHFSVGDTLNISVTLRQGDYIAALFFADAAEFQHWQDGEACYPIWSRNDFQGMGSWSVRVPVTDTYYFVMYNDAILATIKAELRLDVIWWE